jgi:hypothetical protein
MVDEMDLLRGMKDAEPLRAAAFEAARATLRATMAVDACPEAKPRRAGSRAWGIRAKVGFGITTVAAVAAAAAAITVTSSPAPVTAPAASAGNPQLAQLADTIVVSESKLRGNASLEIRNNSASSAAPGPNGVDLFSDSGKYYWALTESGLPQAIAGHQDGSDGSYKGDIAAALYAVNGNITTARARMAVAGLAPGIKPKEISPPGAKPLTREQQADNQIWSNSLGALNAGAANPQVRAGVLRLLSTIHGVTVTNVTVDGQPALTLADPIQTPSGTAQDVLVINASTGLPIVTMTGQGGETSGVTYYHVTRVTLASVAAGKF